MNPTNAERAVRDWLRAGRENPHPHAVPRDNLERARAPVPLLAVVLRTVLRSSHPPASRSC